jgi:hypothetical protein
MNIFVLDNDITKCAQAHTDKHVVKMILESAQILCTVLHNTGIQAPYKKTHVNHPCTIWANESVDNWLWLKCFALALNEEYKYRYDKVVDHKSAIVIKNLPTPNLPSKGMTEFAKAMPDNIKIISDPVEAYRQYYMQEKRHIAKWTKREKPSWWK